MPASDSFVAFAAVSFALIIVPGPSVMFVVSRAIAHGRRAALFTVAGNALGVYLQLLLVAVGLGVIVERSAVVFSVLKLAGAAYLVWLGVSAIRHRASLAKQEMAVSAAQLPRSSFLDGLIVGVANPKAIVFFMAILPQFVDPQGAPAALQMMMLGLVFVAVALLSDGMWGIAAGTARQWFSNSPKRLERMSSAGGVVMIGLGVRLAFTGRSD
ncbi:MAG: LysE family translocator [Ilumatobacteraceae bacterium]|nr:LysE family translocator [Ilumatobacteraceae bacterium]